MERKTIGQFIAALRRVSGMTQKQLAEKLNVSDKTISRWERDECAPDLTLIPVIAEVFGVTSDEILRGERVVKEAVKDREAAKTEKQETDSEKWESIIYDRGDSARHGEKEQIAEKYIQRIQKSYTPTETAE